MWHYDGLVVTPTRKFLLEEGLGVGDDLINANNL